MKHIPFRDMYQTDYHLKHLFAINQNWKNRPYFSMMDIPRKTSALIYYKDCSATYRFSDKEPLCVPRGSLVYLPQGSLYTTSFEELQSSSSHTQLLEFELLDSLGEPFCAMNEVSIIHTSIDNYQDKFDELIEICASPFYSHSLMKARVYEFLHEISKSFHYEKIYSRTFMPIAKGILYLEQNQTYDLSVSQIAQMCHVSESCFRRLFQQYCNLTPSEYKMQKLIRRAKVLLRSGNLTVSEVADRLGYEDSAYFSRIFKKRTGLTPGDYGDKTRA